MSPFCVSITGADQEVLPEDLFQIQERFPFVEWALLYFPEKEGRARYPATSWRERFLDDCAHATSRTALHLCGAQAFKNILEGRIPAEFSRYDRLQLNINARHRGFTDDEVRAIYMTLLERGHSLILQYHAASAPVILDFLASLQNAGHAGQVDVLFDTSRGTGLVAESWPASDQFPIGTRCGYAGGISPDNVLGCLAKIEFLPRSSLDFWLDMESGVRTDNHFDLEKVEAVLKAVQGFQQ